MAWGKAHFNVFAWRDEPDPWLALVAEMMLQRTRAPQAEAAFLLFKMKYPRAEHLAGAADTEVAALTSRLGLHWRGPLLKETARIVAERGGTPPERLEELVALPGVGPYASAAWLSLHRNKRGVIIDANVARWLARMTGQAYDAETRRKRWVRELADTLTPLRAFRTYNYAVLDFTMEICRPGKPRCNECPIRLDCVFGTTAQAVDGR
ncbi:MAG: hypothetical protein LC114_00970 [Bryobacterales bacterium]|nr:hypothetical protein [Bryobacterales bacterium]